MSSLAVRSFGASRQYSVLAGLATAGATAATSKAAEIVGQTAAELVLGKDEEEGDKGGAKGSFRPVADILRDAAKKIEKLEEKRTRNALIDDLSKHHKEMGKLIDALSRKDESEETESDDSK